LVCVDRGQGAQASHGQGDEDKTEEYVVCFHGSSPIWKEGNRYLDGDTNPNPNRGTPSERRGEEDRDVRGGIF
jgi:hypothetical protein